MKKIFLLILSVHVFLLLFPAGAKAQKKSDAVRTTYIPVYSSIYYGDRDKSVDLAVTLSIRNIGNRGDITLSSIEYYNDSGVLIRNYLNTQKVLKPLETMKIIIKESDRHGGSTAGFLIKWETEYSQNSLFVEAVMIGVYPQGISFTTRGIETSK